MAVALYREGRTVREIAEVMGSTTQAVYQLLVKSGIRQREKAQSA